MTDQNDRNDQAYVTRGVTLTLLGRARRTVRGLVADVLALLALAALFLAAVCR